MLGHLKPSTCQLSQPARAQYRNYYCSICASLRKENNLAYSLFINNELTLALSALNPYIKEGKSIKTPCPALVFTQKNQATEHPAVDLAGRISILLGWIKATDWQADNPKFYKKLIKQKLDKKAAKLLPSLSNEFKQLLTDYLELTQSDSTDYEKVRTYSGLVSAGAVKEIASATSIKEEQLKPIYELFQQAGELISIADHLTDLDQDMVLGQYNPILHTAESGEATMSKAYHRLLLAFNRKQITLRDANKALFKEQITDGLFQQAFSQSLQQIANEVASKKPQFLSDSPADELVFQLVMSDIVGMDACCDASPQVNQCCCGGGHGGGCQCCHGGGGGCPCCNGGGGGGCQCDGCCHNCGNGCKGCSNCCSGCGNGCNNCGDSCGNCCGGCNKSCTSCGNCCSNCNGDCGNCCSNCGNSCNDCNSCCGDCGNCCDGCNDCCNGCNCESSPNSRERDQILEDLIENTPYDTIPEEDRKEFIQRLDSLMKNDPESYKQYKELLESFKNLNKDQ